jgi:hypothetical protein
MENPTIKGLVVGGLAGAILGAGLLAGFGAMEDGRDPFSQDSFPCQEDEVLGYVGGNFDGVECMHIDTTLFVECDDFDGNGTVECVDGHTGAVVYTPEQ